MGTSATRRVSARTNAGWTLFLATVICLVAAPSALAAASYVFEPTLSLTGNCSTSGLDPVHDPGTCPIPPGTTFSGSPGADHPSARLEAASVTLDSFGDIYVASMLEGKGRIDVFAPDGTFITEFADTAGPQSVAVDAKGNVYLFERLSGGAKQVRRFPPKTYKPEAGEIEYGEEPVVLANDKTKPVIPLSFESSLAVEPTSQRLYVNTSHAIAVFGSAEEENKLLEAETVKGLVESSSTAIDAKHKKIYFGDRVPLTTKSVIRIFELEAPHKELGKINGSTTPKGEFLSGQGFLEVDVDEETGHVFVGDIVSAGKVYEFEEDGSYLATIEHSFEVAVGPGGIPGEIAVDNGPKSPRPQKEAWLFVPSVPSPSLGRVYAFEPHEECEVEVESASVTGVTDTEAVLRARINPCGLATDYRLEYISQQQYEEEGESFANATVAGEGTLPKGGEGVPVSTPVTGLHPATSYRFRAFAEDAEGVDEKQRIFSTLDEPPPPPCPNDPLRTDLAALLPDCRAYELVTPPDTNGLPPVGTRNTGIYFPTLEVSPDGSHASFLVEGGLIPGFDGAGAFNGDPYVSSRGPDGWSTELIGPDGKEIGPLPGGLSPDQTYSVWAEAQKPTVFLRFPDGHSEPVGQGSLGTQGNVEVQLLTEGGGHVIFRTSAQLEPNAPPTGTATVYDRPAVGPTHVVSLLPGDETPKAGENAKYLGASEEGEGIAFSINGAIYLRLHNEETFKVAGPGTTFAGVTDEGRRVFYLEGGDLFAFDSTEGKAIEFSSSGDVTPVNVAAGGTRAYFVSPSVLAGESNPNGEEAKAGKENLYLSEEGAISFVGLVTERDVEGEKRIDGSVGGLGLWSVALETGKPAKDPSRTTPSGTTLLFESRADLTGFESEGFAQVYRYDSAQGRLDCLSCSPTGTPPTSDASLQSIAEIQGSPEPATAYQRIPNQAPDGQRAFFQTSEPLVMGDTDGFLDVYEWEGEGIGSCGKPGGCIYLISGGQSGSPDYLYGMSATGDDVFFRTSELLLGRDVESTASIYDARVEGGFPEPEPEPECEGEGCHPVVSPPELSVASTSVGGLNGNVPTPSSCPKGKHKAKRHGKSVCVRNHKKKHRHHRAGSNGKGGAR